MASVEECGLEHMVYTVEEYGYPGQNVVALYDPNKGRLDCRCGFREKEVDVVVGSKNDELYKKCMSGIRQIRFDLQVCNGNNTMDRSPKAACDVRDPAVVHTKEAPSTRGHKGKKRRCTKCRKTGHTKRRCTEPQRNFTSTKDSRCPTMETTVRKLEAVLPNVYLHVDQGKGLDEGDNWCREEDDRTNDRWDHVIGAAQSQTRNMGRLGNAIA
ncbi:hypothetical protein AHAS_Ahas20G0267700 [Arachis hypogaea]